MKVIMIISIGLLLSTATACSNKSELAQQQNTPAPVAQSKQESTIPTPMPKADSQAKSPEQQKVQFEITDVKFENDQYGIRYVTGTLKNNFEKDAKFVGVNINLYDDDGNQVGSTVAAVQSLDALGTWKFKAPVTEKTATKFKIKDVTSL